MYALQRSTLIITILSLWLWGAILLAQPAYAATSPVDADPSTWDWSAWDEEDDFQACGTLVGEGELCGWPQIDPDEYENGVQDGNTGDGQAADQDNGRPGDEMSEPGVCPVPVGEGVLCTGPTPLDVPDSSGSGDLPPPSDSDASEPGEPDAGGTDSGDTDAGDKDADNLQGDDSASGNLDTTPADGCVNPIAGGVVGCGPHEPEMPVGGQELSAIRLFAPALSNRP